MSRTVFALTICICLVIVGAGYATNSTEATFDDHLRDDGVSNPDPKIVPPSDNITVIATDSNSWLGSASEGPRARAELVAFDPDGTLLYYNDSHTRYWDVDPVSGTEATVEVGFSDHLGGAECPTEWNHSRRQVSPEVWSEYERGQENIDACTRNGIERVNLTTGEVTRIWTEFTPGKPGTRYHDTDRLNETHYVIGDIYLDRVLFVNTSSSQVEWAWNATSEFSTDSGGPYPEDWTHINDVEVLDDGRIMASVRNQDQVVFLDRSTGLLDQWTLGEEGNDAVLYEQHNPDYIPDERGGPAVLVADSGNDRLVEYQRTGGDWTRSWIWQDSRLQWPRDADRLPNGNTLITDSNGNRVFEVNEQGEIVWSVTIAFPYEAERLGTGDESAGGTSARRADLESRSGASGGLLQFVIKEIIPGKYLNALVYVTPVWMGIPELLALIVGTVTAAIWAGVEVRRWYTRAPE